MFEQRTKYNTRRKQICEAMAPAPKDVVRAGVGDGPIADGEADTADYSETATTCRSLGGRGNTSFASETAAVTGENVRSIQRTLAVSNVLGGNTLDRVSGTSLDVGVELVAPMKAAFLNVADSINSLDATNQTMQPAHVALINSSVKLKVSINKMKPVAKLPALDLFGLPEQATKRTNERPEAAALAEVLKALKAHSLVAWAERQNSGAVRSGGRFIRFGWVGCADVLGQLKDGRFLGVEVKAAKGRASPEQVAFLERINAAGGVRFIAHSLRDVVRELGPL